MPLLLIAKPVTMRQKIFMDPKIEIQQSKKRPFWQQYLLILAVDSIIVIIGALLLGNIRQISNLYFYSTLVLLVIAAIPIFFEAGTRVKAMGSSLKDGEKAAEQLKEKQSKFDRGARTTYLFGVASFTTFLLAIITLIIG